MFVAQNLFVLLHGGYAAVTPLGTVINCTTA